MQLSPAPLRPRGTPFTLVVALVALALGAGACRTREASSAVADTARATADGAATHRPPGYVVDSVRPVEEALHRFRAGLTSVRALDGGAGSRDELVTGFVRALERGDTATLRRLELSKAEFAYLYYPSSIYTRPPYTESPEILWMLQRARGEAGFRRLVERYGGRSLGYRGYRCPTPPLVQGDNRLWGDCVVTYRRAKGDTATGRLFGAVLERDGRFKVMSYANDF